MHRKSPYRPRYQSDRKGATLVLVAALAAVLMILCGSAVNVAYMQLNRTELRVATDAAARAAGRAFSEYQDVDAAIDHAVSTAAMNDIFGTPLAIDPEDDAGEIVFGTAGRLDGADGTVGSGRYTFTTRTTANVRDQSESATAVRVYGRRTNDSTDGSIPMLFSGFSPFSEFEPVVYSTSTQVDRDIALILDRSGSMLYYQDEDGLTAALETLLNTYEMIEVDGYWDGSWQEVEVTDYYWSWTYWAWIPYTYTDTQWVEVWVDEPSTVQGDNTLISQAEYDAATEFLYDRTYTDNVVTQLATLSSEMSEYTSDWSNWENAAPRHSRWSYLVSGVDAFLEVLEDTDQEELVSLTTFNSSPSLDLDLTSTYSSIVSEVASIVPYSGTGIGQGMDTGLPTLFGDYARPYAAKTIIVLTDGENNTGSSPDSTASSLVTSYNVTIHSMTFGEGLPESATTAMSETARIGGGKYYHADTGTDLIANFREIANNLPTIITE